MYFSEYHNSLSEFRCRVLTIGILIILFYLPESKCYAEHRFINLGGGVSWFVPPLYSDPSRFSVSPSYNFFIEKPDYFYLSGDSTLLLTPGVSYFNFSQSEGPGNALGGGGTLDLKHKSYGAYLKVNYQKKYKPEKIFRWYFGAVTGIHFYTKTYGTRSWWMMQGNGQISGSETVDSDASQFFNSFYAGLIGGFNPKVGSGALLKPAFEVSFLPNFISITDEPVRTFAEKGVKSIVMFSVILGL